MGVTGRTLATAAFAACLLAPPACTDDRPAGSLLEDELPDPGAVDAGDRSRYQPGDGDGAPDLDAGPTDSGADPDPGPDPDPEPDPDPDPDAGPNPEPEPEPEPDPEPEPEPEPICPDPLDGRIGLHALDVNGDPLEPGDVLEVTLEVVPGPGAGDAPAWVRVLHGNARIEADSIEITGDAGEPVIGGPILTLPLPRVGPLTVRYRVTTASRYELSVVLATLNRQADGCPNPGSGSGAALQLVGGDGKTPLCVDFADYASLQIAPAVALRSTRAYREANGVRDDLVADDFIFCPQQPTIVHSAELCVVNDADVDVTLAGSWRADGDWEVDDFALFEVLVRDELVASAVTSQSHPGGNTFWCPEIQQLMCTEGCTATLRREAGGGDDAIEPLAVVSAVGPRPRRHEDGAVSITHLLPDDERQFQLRVTALDVGEEGTVRPDLYLVMRPR